MRDKGLDKNELLDQLNRFFAEDMDFRSGRILGSFCTVPHPLAAEIFTRYLEKNIGDAGLFPGTVKLEQETIRALGSLLGHDHCYGAIVTGGTEANLIAMWSAKKRAAKNQREVILPRTAHYSFDKAASLMDLELIKIPLNSRFQMDLKEVSKAINPHTMALVGVAGSTDLGMVDDIEQLSALALGHDLFLHVDAAFGGYVLPFLEEAGYPAPPFDFRFPGVSSITVDPHKMGRSVIPAGCILFRDKKLYELAQTEVGYLSGGKVAQPTIVGTRSGASVASVWSAINHLGRQGYARIVKNAMELTFWLKERLDSMEGVEVVTEPVVNVLGISTDRMPLKRLAQEIRARGWAISLFPRFLRIALMPHLSQPLLEPFLTDLQNILKRSSL